MDNSQTLRLEQDVINGFSYSFCQSLHDALVEMKENGDLFEKRSRQLHTLSKPGCFVVAKLHEQLEQPGTRPTPRCSTRDVNELIETAATCLSFFE